MRAFLYRIVITLINIFIPPLSVALLAGVEWDCTLNCILFFLGVLPSHVHGFYISCVYFHRRKKVKKGRWPGGPKFLIHSTNVLLGGATPRQAESLYLREFGGGSLVEKRTSSSRHHREKRSPSRDHRGSHGRHRGHGDGRSSPRPREADMGMVEYRDGSSRSRRDYL